MYFHAISVRRFYALDRNPQYSDSFRKQNIMVWYLAVIHTYILHLFSIGFVLCMHSDRVKWIVFCFSSKFDIE